MITLKHPTTPLLLKEKKIIVFQFGMKRAGRTKTLSKFMHTVIIKTGFQIAAFYNPSSEELNISFGGMDFTNIRDIFQSGGQQVSGHISRRILKVSDAIDQTIQNFEKKYPNHLAKTKINIAGHSSGTESAFLANYILKQKYNIDNVNKLVLMDEVNSANTVSQLSNMISSLKSISSTDAEKELIGDVPVISVKAEKGSFIDDLYKFNYINMGIGPGNAHKKYQNADYKITLKESTGGIFGQFKNHMGAFFIKSFSENKFDVQHPFQEKNVAPTQSPVPLLQNKK